MDFQAKLAQIQAACAAVDTKNVEALRLAIGDALRAGVPPTHPIVQEAQSHLDRVRDISDPAEQEFQQAIKEAGQALDDFERDLAPLRDRADQFLKRDAREALERLRAQVMTLVPDDRNSIGEAYRLALKRGHRQACHQVFDLISKALGDYVPPSEPSR